MEIKLTFFILVLLERVLLKLGLTETDEQLEQQLNKFLAPVLLKIVSPHEEVRKKVMEIFTHVNKRLKARGQVKLDLLPLLKHYSDSSNSFLINFAIIYITIGFPRLDLEKQIELVPTILRCIESKPEPHQNKLLLMILPLLGDIKITEKQDDLGLSERANARQMLLSMLLDVLLLPYGHSNENEIPPGMSPYSLRRVSLEDKRAEHLENVISTTTLVNCSISLFSSFLAQKRNCQVFGK
jgi:proteasome component ECM29